MTMNNRLPTTALVMSALGLLAAASAGAAVSDAATPALKTALPYPTKDTALPRDIGTVSDIEGSGSLTVTLALKLRDEAGAEALFSKLYSTTSPSFHQFLTPAEFKAKFAQTDAAVADVAAKLAKYGLTTTRSGASTLRVTGSPAALEQAFEVSLHVYQVDSSAGSAGYRYHAPNSAPKVPTEVGAVVDSVIGLSTRPQFAPQIQHAFAKGVVRKPAKVSGNATINQPGFLTVADFESQYNATPLINKGITGKGRTVAIVTLANLTVSDAYAYWSAVGLNVASNRVTVVAVDGGAGPPSDASGSDETTLDVEQAGGVASGASVIVYQAPNTGQAFVDAFVNAVEDDTAQSISTSWGEWEWFDNLENNPVTDPFTGETVSVLRAYTEVFLQAALQGQSLFAAAGDAGAYDVNRGFPPPDFSLVLSVDSPAANPYITAAGGTTLPGTQTYEINSTGQIVTINIPNERIWSWDYLVPLCDDLDLDPFACGIFPVGGGGGVSVYYGVPSYQQGLAGVKRSQPDQSFVDYVDSIPPTDYFNLPAYYAGRNVPDVSANADPETGYLLYYTSDQSGFEILSFFGGTSFVAPQLNGVTALLGQYLNGKVGLLNIPLYAIAKGKSPYSGKYAPFNAIQDGDNDFYTGRDGYSPAAGIGTLNITNLAEVLKAASY
jgi:subtilase family serine protease